MPGGGGIVVELEDVPSKGKVVGYIGNPVGQKEYSFGGGVPGPSFREPAGGSFYVEELLYIGVRYVCLDDLGTEVCVVNAALGVKFEGSDESFFRKEGGFSGFVFLGEEKVGASGESV
jgi:hypothetical protein